MTGQHGEAIVAQNLRLSYGKKTENLDVLADVSLTVNRGEIAVIVGENGIGKSSLLGIIAGTILPDRGGVSIFNHPSSQAKIGYVWQNTHASLYPWLTALDNAALPLRIKGVGRGKRQARVFSICEQLGFDVPLERMPYELSGGEQQKVSILRALASDCELLLLDEPFANLSFESTLDLLTHIQRVHTQTNVTTLLVSHSHEFSIFAADVVIPLSGKPVSIDNTNRIQVHCPYPHPRPTSWMFEHDFHDQVESLRGTAGGIP